MSRHITKITEQTKSYQSDSLNQTESIAAELLNNFKTNLLFLKGDLGSGKTAFVKGIAKALGVDEVVNSPTFVIMKIYQVDSGKFKRFIHVDLYRFDEISREDLVSLGLKEYIDDPETLVAIEWADKIKGDYLSDCISFKYLSENKREIVVG